MRVAIRQHGQAWIDYFSIQIDQTVDDEFHDERIPGCTRLDEEKLKQQLRGAGGIPRETKSHRKERQIG